MIASLEGTITFRAEKFIVVNVNGVGYKVFMSQDGLQATSGFSDGASGVRDVRLWIHHHVREDAHELYGFLHYAELELFEMLIGISGIGPKGALGILAIAPVDTLKKAIAAGDISYLTRVSGIGKKTAEKVVLELREKMAGKGVSVTAPELQYDADAMDALVALGYSQREAREALASVPADGAGMGVEQRIQSALRRLGKRR